MHTIFNQVPHLFSDKSENSVLTIEKSGDQYVFSVVERATSESAKASLQYLKEILTELLLKLIISLTRRAK